MFLTLFPRRSQTAWWEIEQRRQAEGQAELHQQRFASLVSAYVHEQKHPDCLPEMRFWGTTPKGQRIYGESRAAAEAKILAEFESIWKTS